MTEKLKKINPITVIFAVLSVGILLVIFSGQKNETKETVEEASFDESVYERELERRLKGIVEKIDGVGEVSVMITLDGSAIYTYATDTANDTGSDGDTKKESTVVLSVKGTNNKEAVVSGYKLPEIKGAAIVCSRTLSPVLQSKVIGTVSAALGIPTSKVYVTN